MKFKVRENINEAINFNFLNKKYYVQYIVGTKEEAEEEAKYLQQDYKGWKVDFKPVKVDNSVWGINFIGSYNNVRKVMKDFEPLGDFVDDSYIEPLKENLSQLNADYLDDHMKKYLPIGKILYRKDNGQEVYVAKHFPDNGVGRYRYSVYLVPTEYKSLGRKAISQNKGLRCFAPQVLSNYEERPLKEDTVKQGSK